MKPWFCYRVLVSLRNRRERAAKICVREVMRERRREGEGEVGKEKDTMGWLKQKKRERKQLVEEEEQE